MIAVPWKRRRPNLPGQSRLKEPVLGEKPYAFVMEIKEPIDIVYVFRRSEYCVPIGRDGGRRSQGIAVGASNRERRGGCDRQGRRFDRGDESLYQSGSRNIVVEELTPPRRRVFSHLSASPEDQRFTPWRRPESI